MLGDAEHSCLLVGLAIPTSCLEEPKAREAEHGMKREGQEFLGPGQLPHHPVSLVPQHPHLGTPPSKLTQGQAGLEASLDGTRTRG